jgi:hypothetical protein
VAVFTEPENELHICPRIDDLGLPCGSGKAFFSFLSRLAFLVLFLGSYAVLGDRFSGTGFFRFESKARCAIRVGRLYCGVFMAFPTDPRILLFFMRGRCLFWFSFKQRAALAIERRLVFLGGSNIQAFIVMLTLDIPLAFASSRIHGLSIFQPLGTMLAA